MAGVHGACIRCAFLRKRARGLLQRATLDAAEKAPGRRGIADLAAKQGPHGPSQMLGHGSHDDHPPVTAGEARQALPHVLHTLEHAFLEGRWRF
jgi:hypothetical protein